MRSVLCPSLALLLAPVLAGAQVDVSPPAESEATPSALEILDRAIERARMEADTGYAFELLETVEQVDGDGRIDKVERRLYEVTPMQGIYFARLLEKDGRGLSDREQREERKREREARSKLARGEDPRKEEEQMTLDRELMERYQVRLDCIDDCEGRPCYLLSYWPRTGELPTRRRIDRALNQSEGRIWIDTATYEVAALEFELLEPVKIWSGLIGSITKLDGRLERHPVEEDAWFPVRFDISLRGRMLFKSLRRNQSRLWRNFERALEVEALSRGTSEEEG